MSRKAVKPDPTKGPACFAPPLNEAELAEYKSLAESAEEPVRDAMASLITMVEKFRETPESKLPGVALETPYTQSPFRDGKGNPKAPPQIVPLEDSEVERIWDYVPWGHELNAMGQVFEQIPHESKPELRNAAFHLLWFGRELLLDREPMTNDKI